MHFNPAIYLQNLREIVLVMDDASRSAGRGSGLADLVPFFGTEREKVDCLSQVMVYNKPLSKQEKEKGESIQRRLRDKVLRSGKGFVSVRTLFRQKGDRQKDYYNYGNKTPALQYVH